jgi:hypothetical protein
MRRALVIVMIALQRGSAGKAGFSSLQYLSKVCLRLHQLQTPKPQTLNPKPKRLTRCVPPRRPCSTYLAQPMAGACVGVRFAEIIEYPQRISIASITT